MAGRFRSGVHGWPNDVPSLEMANSNLRATGRGLRRCRAGLRQLAGTAHRPIRRTNSHLARPDAAATRRAATGVWATAYVRAAAARRRRHASAGVYHAAAPAAHRRTPDRKPASATGLSRRRPADGAAAGDHRSSDHAHPRTAPSHHHAQRRAAANSAAPVGRRSVCLSRADDRPSRPPTGAHHDRHASHRPRAAPQVGPSATKSPAPPPRSAPPAAIASKCQPTPPAGPASRSVPPAAESAKRWSMSQSSRRRN